MELGVLDCAIIILSSLCVLLSIYLHLLRKHLQQFSHAVFSACDGEECGGKAPRSTTVKAQVNEHAKAPPEPSPGPENAEEHLGPTAAPEPPHQSDPVAAAGFDGLQGQQQPQEAIDTPTDALTPDAQPPQPQPIGHSPTPRHHST